MLKKISSYARHEMFPVKNPAYDARRRKRGFEAETNEGDHKSMKMLYHLQLVLKTQAKRFKLNLNRT